MLNRSGTRVLVVPGIYAEGVGFSFDHCTDFTLTVDGVVMSTANLKAYFENSRSLPNAVALRRNSSSQVHRQIYFSGLYLYNLLAKAGFDVDLLNCLTEGDRQTMRALDQELSAIVISTTFTWCPQLRPALRLIRKHHQKTKIIIGGRWVYDSYRIFQRTQEPGCDFPPEVLERYFFTGQEPWDEVDLFIVEEHGEQTLVAALDAIGEGRDHRNQLNCAFWESGRLVFTERKPECFDVTNLAIEWRNIPERYHSSVMPLVAGIGCPFKCKFCDYSLSKLYYKPFDTLFEELRQIADSRFINTAWFIDDNFLYNTDRIEQFCMHWNRHRLRLNWYGIVRLDSITETTAKALAATGLKMIMVGVESGSPRILRNMNKMTKLEQYHRAFELLAANGIRAKILLVIGFPGESEETVSETIAFLNSLPERASLGHEIFLSPFCVLPLAHLNNPEDRARFGLSGYLFDWRHDTMCSDQVHAAMLRIFLETNGVYQYYPDNQFDKLSGEARHRFQEMAETRERLRQAQFTPGTGPLQASLWDHLERLVMSLEL